MEAASARNRPSPSSGAVERQPKVLILDANQRSALAATRSLGKRGIAVVAGDETVKTLAGASRYCGETVVYPSPALEPAEFVHALEREVARRGIGVLFPMTDVTVQQVLRNRPRLADVRIPCASAEAFEALTDKWELYALAKRLDVPTPVTYLIRTADELRAAASELGWPVVVKPRRSRLLLEGRWVAPRVECVASAEGLARAWANVGVTLDDGVLVQQHVTGRGQGIFALYDRGQPLTFFAHRRLREKPPWGGVSVLSESIPVDPQLRDLGQRILDHVGWHGVAMVEFKVTPGGRPYVIEVNGRFWGSLQLAIDAGVDFPWLLYRLAVDGSVNSANGYAVGVTSRWLLGDLDHLYARLRESSSVGEKGCAIMRFLSGFGSGTRHEVNRWEDMRPFVFELGRYFAR